MTYLEVQLEYKRLYNKTIKTCWIADVKRELGLITRIAYNRSDSKGIKNNCKDFIVRERIRKIISG